MSEITQKMDMITLDKRWNQVDFFCSVLDENYSIYEIVPEVYNLYIQMQSFHWVSLSRMLCLVNKEVIYK